MLPEHHVPYKDEACPISDDLLGALYRASPHGLNELISTVPPKARALLAVYCYRRAHLASIGLAIAATCDHDDLTGCGGNIGAVLFERSREPPVASPPNDHATNRRKITLATKAIQQRKPMEDVEDLSLSRPMLERAASILPKLRKSFWR
jgi:hypothetical protein